MKLPVCKYGDPILRKKGAHVSKVTPEIIQLIADMFETMEANHGVGLAAQQIGQALQLTVIDIRPIEDRPSTLELDGQPADPKSIMPLVLLNPVVKPVGEKVAGSEGCLSFPKLYGEIERPESVDVTATNEKGEHLAFRCGGLLARCVQHETDHLNGILFIDRMDRQTKEELKPDLEDLQAATKAALKKAKK
ncbi:MAG: peptide deformylase [Proteobacteria bacterium]|jgi:peptide deformylase|nr:peptide deformylase [Pseudomonadota bacterium]